MKIKISEIEQTFKEIFEEEEGRVSSVETVYEMDKDEKYYKLVISIHNLSIEDTLIIHTKFIFKTDLEKRNIVENAFIYLYDIDCVYHKMDFKNVIDLKSKIEDIVISNDFGEDLQILSDFIEAPAMFLNYYMKRAKITDYSIYEVKYEPKFKTTPCDKITFDFEININNNYRIFLSISKNERKKDEVYDTYTFQFRFLDEYKTIESDTLQNIHFMIGSNVAKLLDEKINK
jgi:hypothetical protein